jgi:NAD-dependent deacetylase
MDAVREARQLIEQARVVSVLTGAGISTASGIPDFRGPEGIWTKDPQAEMLATYDVWVRDAETRRRAWHRRIETRDERHAPNEGHLALVDLERSGRLDVLVTQNVDGLHRDAGTSPERLVEIHGSARDAVCLRCGDRGPIERVLDRVAAGDADPTCLVELADGRCAGIIKSATISFGQSLVELDLRRAEHAAARCEVLLAVGSTLSVWPIAAMVPTARSHGAVVVIVNGGPTAMDDEASVLVGGAIEDVLPEVASGLAPLAHSEAVSPD